MQSTRQMPVAESGPVALVVAGQTFTADLQNGPVLTISRETAFGNFEGKLAKDVAQQFCVSRDRMLEPQAFGHFKDGSWIFKGGCA